MIHSYLWWKIYKKMEKLHQIYLKLQGEEFEPAMILLSRSYFSQPSFLFSEIKFCAFIFCDFISSFNQFFVSFRVSRSDLDVTQQALAFVRNISMHPEAWLDFPLSDDDEDSDGLRPIIGAMTFIFSMQAIDSSSILLQNQIMSDG